MSSIAPLSPPNPPKVHSPIVGVAYHSPVPVHLEVNGGAVARTYQANFHPGGDHKEDSLNNQAFVKYSHAREPGPNKFDSRLLTEDREQSDYTFVDWFYVLTPPAKSFG